jgi:Ca2+ transporting ATPase
VIRSGNTVNVSVFDLLVGDVFIVSTGDKIPTDAVLIEGAHMKADESNLTGEPED